MMDRLIGLACVGEAGIGGIRDMIGAPRLWVGLEGLIRSVDVEPEELGVDPGELEKTC